MGAILSMDADDLFAYYTVKYVMVRDRYLGILYYCFVLAILYYNVVVVLYQGKNYLEYEKPIGAILSYVTNGQFRNMDPVEPSSSPHRFCKVFNYEWYHPGDREGDVKRTSPSEKKVDINRFEFDCSVKPLDADQISSVSSNDVFVATRQTVKTYELQKNGERLLAKKEETYVLDVDKVELRLQHSYMARRFQMEATSESSRFSGTSTAMDGELVRYERTKPSEDGSVWSKMNQGQLKKSEQAMIKFSKDSKLQRRGDRIPIGALLDAADVRLNRETEKSTGDESNKKEPVKVFTVTSPLSARRIGVVIIVLIDYKSSESDPSTVEYEITASAIRDSRYSVLKSIVTNEEGTTQTVTMHHGIKFIFIQTGSISRFDMQNMLFQLAAAMSMIAVATLVVDTLMEYFLPLREYYTGAKYEITQDFSDLKDELRLKNKAAARVRQEEIINQQREAAEQQRQQMQQQAQQMQQPPVQFGARQRSNRLPDKGRL